MGENSSPHVEGNFDRHSLRHSCLQWSETDRVGKRRTASATRHTEARCKAAKITRSRPIVLDRADDDLEGLEVGTGYSLSLIHI